MHNWRLEEDWEDAMVGDRPYTGDWEDYFDIHPLSRQREARVESICRHGEIEKECAVCHMEAMDSR